MINEAFLKSILVVVFVLTIIFTAGYGQDDGKNKAIKNYESAKKNFEAEPNEENTIWLGRRTAYLGKYKEAIAIYTRGLERFPNSYRLYRHRGHRYISTRQFAKAIIDFKKAARSAEGKPLEIEPDGLPNAANIPLSNTHFNIYYHLGLAYYLTGNFQEAVPTYKKCLAWCKNDDSVVAATHWLYMTYRRMNDKTVAQNLLTGITEKMTIIESQDYHELLLMYKGLRTPGPGLKSAAHAYGVGNWYYYNGQKKKAKEIFDKILKTKAVAAFGFIAAEVDVARLSFPGQSKQHEQWRHSLHAQSMSDPEERIRMNKTGCAHCHTAQGYWEVILEGKKSTAPYKDATGITCVACHPAGKDGKPNGAAFRSGSVKTACTGCHDILVQNDTQDFSSCPQGSFLKGKGGAEFKGKTYKTGAHSQIEKNCAGCHMARPPKGKAADEPGGHTFRVITKGETPRRFNPNGCTPCHDAISYGFITKSQAKYKKLMQTLQKLLPQRPNGTFKVPDQSPRLPKDPSLSKIEAMASYNYYQVLKDGTYGVHNPVYIKRLLEDSIQSLRSAQ
ncbi:MAG: tetratricopeptide repeat protein [bacterium]|nr:tetratricopeptide repeat protein [bacterium]